MTSPAWLALFIVILAAPASLFAQTATFRVQDAALLDPCGETFVIRGVNAGIAFPGDTSGKSLPEIAKTGANSVRLTFRWLINRSDPNAVGQALRAAEENQLIAIPALWDATGDWSQLPFAVDYWAHPTMVEVLRKHEDTILLNIANEAGNASVTADQFRDGYAKAIRRLRDAGLHMPLVIDAANWGRREDDLLEHASYLMAQDPDSNLIFSWHPWDTGKLGKRYENAFEVAKAKRIPLLIGEFAHLSVDEKTPIDYKHLMQLAQQNRVGWLWWWWHSGKRVDAHAMTQDGRFGNWVNMGEEVALTSPWGIQRTAAKTRFLQDRKCKSASQAMALPKAPSQLQAEATVGAEVLLRWQDHATDERNFDVEMWDEHLRRWRLVKVVGPDVTQTRLGGDQTFVYGMDPVRDISLAYDTTYTLRVGAYKSRGRVAYSEPVTVKTRSDPRTCEQGDGLYGKYFSAEHRSQSFTDYSAPNLTRVDPVLNFNWLSASPAPGLIADDHFQVRWTGFVQPQFTGLYTFYTDSDDFARVSVNDRLLINNWRGNASGWAQGQIHLEGGKQYLIRVEYREWNNDAKIRLFWAHSKIRREIVPACRLYSLKQR